MNLIIKLIDMQAFHVICGLDTISQQIREVYMKYRIIYLTFFWGLFIVLCTHSPVFSNNKIIEPVQLPPVDTNQTVLKIITAKGVKQYTIANESVEKP